MTRLLTIGIASLTAKPGDREYNLAQITWAAQHAARSGCDLLLTPEMSATGYGGYPEIIACAERAGDGPIYEHLAALAQRTGVVMTAGFVEDAGATRYLSHYVVYPDGNVVVQRKNRVTPREQPLDAAVPLFFDDTEEIGHVDANQAYWQFFSVKGVRCGIVICADLGVKQLHSRRTDDNGRNRRRKRHRPLHARDACRMLPWRWNQGVYYLSTCARCSQHVWVRWQTLLSRWSRVHHRPVR